MYLSVRLKKVKVNLHGSYSSGQEIFCITGLVYQNTSKEKLKGNWLSFQSNMALDLFNLGNNHDFLLNTQQKQTKKLKWLKGQICVSGCLSVSGGQSVSGSLGTILIGRFPIAYSLKVT